MDVLIPHTLPLRRGRGPVWALVFLLLTFWFAGILALPVIQDEAYYAVWSRHMAWGFFDHPPMVALLGFLSQYFPGNTLALRFGSWVLGGLTIPLVLQLFRQLGFKGWAPLFTGLLLVYGNILGLFLGVLTTPDTALMLAWVFALSEASKALVDDEKRWLSAGFVTGLGLLAKYTMALIGPVFLWALICTTRNGPGRGLRSIWPYAGGLLALLVVSPHLVWNAQHDWITVRFQFRHGLALERPENTETASLPRPVKATSESPEYLLAKPFLDFEKAEEKKERPSTWVDRWMRPLESVGGFLGSQLGLWGGCLWAIFLGWRRRLPSPKDTLRGIQAPRDRALYTLMKASAVVPLLVCGLLSIPSKVEANWPAMYVFGAAAWMVPWVTHQRRKLAWGVVLNVLISGSLVVHAAVGGFLPIKPTRDRLLHETHGYRQLAGILEEMTQGLPLFVETYQLASMLTFYRPSLNLGQWPGITRDSEFVRNPDLHGVERPELDRLGAFWLVTTHVPPPRLAPFTADRIFHLRDCQAMELQVITSPISLGRDGAPCQRPIHKWYLVRFTR